MQAWADVVPPFQFSTDLPQRDIFVATPSTTPFSHLMSSALLLDHPALLCGPTGCGKSSVARAVLHRPHAWNTTTTTTAFGQTPQHSYDIRAAEMLLGSHTSVSETRACVDRWFGRRTSGARRPCGGAQLVFFVDDMSLPLAEVSGAQPPLELLRMVLVRTRSVPVRSADVLPGGWPWPVIASQRL